MRLARWKNFFEAADVIAQEPVTLAVAVEVDVAVVTAAATAAMIVDIFIMVGTVLYGCIESAGTT